MRSEDLFRVLRSPLRMEILKLTGEKSMSINDILLALNKQGFNIKYRESVYKSVEKLVSIGLVEKSYDSDTKRIIYSLRFDNLKIDLRKGDVSFL